MRQDASLIRPKDSRERACPRCGDRFILKPRGRPQKWCSPACRRAAHAERVAAEYACLAVNVVETVDVLEHDVGDCASRVAASPPACRRVLRAISQQARSRDLRTDPDWRPVIEAFWQLHEALLSSSRNRQ